MADKIRVLIVDDIAETRENIRKLLQFEPDIDVVGMARTGREGLQLSKELKPNVVLMDINMPDMDGIQATSLIVKEMPGAQIVIVSVQSDTDYLRRAMLAGARDFLPKPPSADELINTIRRLGEMSRQQQEMRVQPVQPGQTAAPAKMVGVSGKIITVFSPKGGAGCTAIATNLAITLQSEECKVVVVDANSQFGDVGVFFNLKGKHSLASLAEAASAGALENDYLQSVLVTHGSNVKVLLGPPTPQEAVAIDDSPNSLKAILEKLTEQFHYVIVDTASVLRNLELVALDVSDRIILVANPDIPSLASVKKFFDLSEQLGYPVNKIMLVVNKVDKRGGISAAGIEESMKHTVAAQVLADEKTVFSSINNGVPFIQGSKNLPPVQGILDLAQKIKEEFAPKAKEAPVADKKTAPVKKSLFDRR